jgi:ankyrin repeat protein
LNTFDYEGMTALHLAAEQGLLLVARHLIEEFNVDPTVMTQSTEGPQGVQLSAMHVAILSNRIDIVEYFCSIRELVEIETSLGDAPIHLACMTSIDCARLLLEAGANPHAENSEGKSPYKVKCVRSDHSICSYFVSQVASESEMTDVAAWLQSLK